MNVVLFVCNIMRLVNWALFFFNDTATTEIYTLSLHDALPIFRTSSRRSVARSARRSPRGQAYRRARRSRHPEDRKSTRLNSSHDQISYAVFCLKKKTMNAGGPRSRLFHTMCLPLLRILFEPHP